MHKKTTEPKTVEEVRNLVNDMSLSKLSPQEREKKATANKIARILWDFVDKQNDKADNYYVNFARWVDKKIEHKKNKKIDLEPGFFGKAKNEIFETLKKTFNTNVILHQWSDIDKKAAIFLLQKAGFFKDTEGEDIDLKKAIREMSHDQNAKKWLIIDKESTTNGLQVENVSKNLRWFRGAKVVISEHSNESLDAEKTAMPTSSTHIVSEMLNKLSVFENLYTLRNIKSLSKDKAERLNNMKNEKLKQIQRFVKFVDIVDSMNYQLSGEEYGRYGHKTLLGLNNNISIEHIFDYFEDPKYTGFEILDDEFLKKHSEKKERQTKNWKIEITKTWLEISQERQKEIEKNIAKYQELDEKWYVIALNGTPFVVDLKNEIQHGAQAAQYFEGGIFKIHPQGGNLYVYSSDLLPATIGGVKTKDGHFLIVNELDQKTLESILNDFGLRGHGSSKAHIREEILNSHKKILERNTKKPKPMITYDTVELGKPYEGKVSRVLPDMGYLISVSEAKWLLHKSALKHSPENREKQYKVGDSIKVVPTKKERKWQDKRVTRKVA